MEAGGDAVQMNTDAPRAACSSPVPQQPLPPAARPPTCTEPGRSAHLRDFLAQHSSPCRGPKAANPTQKPPPYTPHTHTHTQNKGGPPHLSDFLSQHSCHLGPKGRQAHHHRQGVRPSAHRWAQPHGQLRAGQQRWPLHGKALRCDAVPATRHGLLLFTSASTV